MEQLIKDLLSFSQMGEGALKRTKVDMNAILDDVRVTLEPLIQEKSANVTSRSLPTVVGDASVDAVAPESDWQRT